MKKKLLSLLVLLMVAVTGAWAETIVTWDRNNISDIYVDSDDSYSKEGITLSSSAGDIDAYWFGLGDEANEGIQFEAFESGGFTFSNTLDKKFVKIEMTVRDFNDWDSKNLGTGWALTEDDDNRIYKVTWTGDAASTVDLLKDEDDFAGETVISIVFYLVGDDPEPATYTLQLVVNDAAMGSVAVTNLLGSGIVDNQDGTYTVPENAEVKLLATANKGYKFTGWREGNLNDLVGCYYCGVALNTLDNSLTFTMTEDKDVLATFAALTYSVALKEGTEDAAKWTVEPTDAAAGTQVTVTYSGSKKVKSVKAVKKAAASDNITVYFTDAVYYGDVCVYYWPNGGDWPGSAMTFVEENSYYQQVYKAVIPADAVGIVFNGNGRQTVDITENIVDGAWWYSKEGIDDQGHNYVGFVDNNFINMTPTDGGAWTFAMPDFDVELEVEYYPEAAVAEAPTAIEDGVAVDAELPIFNEGTAVGGTMLYFLTQEDEKPTTTADFKEAKDIPNANELTTGAGTYYLYYYVQGDAEHSDSEIMGPVVLKVVKGTGIGVYAGQLQTKDGKFVEQNSVVIKKDGKKFNVAGQRMK